MKKFCAVAMTAALVLPVVATSAAAQDETITVEGLFYLDRNGDNAFNEGENVHANGRGVAVRVQGSTELVGTFPTGPDGRYKAVLPKGPKYTITNIDMTDYTTTKVGHGASESTSGVDFPLRGYFLNGFSFVDTNGDGVKQSDEKVHSGKVKVTGQVQTGAQFSGEAQAGADGAYRLDLPLGALTLTAPNLAKEGLTLAKPTQEQDVDWVTGTRALGAAAGERDIRVDVRYVEAKADIALESALTPVRDSYTLGEQVDLKLTLSNKGNVPVAPEFVLGSFFAKMVSHSDNVTLRPGTEEDFTVKDKILPGQQVEVALKIELDELRYAEVHAMARFIFSGFPDTNHRNNVAVLPIKVVAKGTTVPATSTTSATAAPTTTTTPAVAKAGNKTGLASTGASVFEFLGLGALLLAAGAAAFFMARRRRS